MKGDLNLPEGWQGSYGTLNMGRALADIHARLLALEAAGALRTEGPYAAVMITRRKGLVDSKHVTVWHQPIYGFPEAIERMGHGDCAIFVEPSISGLVLDMLEADGKQAQ